jgi:hypothetical protein
MLSWFFSRKNHTSRSSSGHSNCETALATGSSQNHLRGSQKNLQVQPQTPILDVRQIKGYIAIERWILARVNLPKAGNAGQHFKPAKVLQLVLSDLVGQRRPGANQAHITKQDVHELGEFIQAILAQNPA